MADTTETRPGNPKKQILKLKGKTAVFIDYANVYNWKEKLKWEINIKKLFTYLKIYKKIKEIRFYFGTDTQQETETWLLCIKD